MEVAKQQLQQVGKIQDSQDNLERISENNNSTYEDEELKKQLEEAEQQLEVAKQQLELEKQQKSEVKTKQQLEEQFKLEKQQLEEQLEVEKQKLEEAEQQYNKVGVNTFNPLLNNRTHKNSKAKAKAKEAEAKEAEAKEEKVHDEVKNKLYKNIQEMIHNLTPEQLKEIYDILNYTNISNNNFVQQAIEQKGKLDREESDGNNNLVEDKLKTLEFAKTAQQQKLTESIIGIIKQMMDDLTPEQLKQINITLGV